MAKFRSLPFDIRIVVAALLLNALVDLVSIVVLQKGEVRYANMGSVYEKVKICLTSTSILLGASGFLFSAFATRAKDRAIRERMIRALTWFVVALLSGIVNVGVMPTRISLNGSLEPQHVAQWLWSFGTGPIMYLSLILGTIWFALSLKGIKERDEDEAPAA